MQNRFSFETADELINLLKQAHTVLGNQSDKVISLYKNLGSAFKDSGYVELLSNMTSAYHAGQATRQQLGVIIASISKYKDELYRLYTEDLIAQIGFKHIEYAPTARFGVFGEELEKKNRRLAFQNEIILKIKSKVVPLGAKEVFARVGSKCVVASDSYEGTAFYSPSAGFIKFNCAEDLSNPCGVLSTYFHEIGHMIDYQTIGTKRLSDDKTFCNALRNDCDTYINKTCQRYGCTTEEAYYHIRKELMSNNNLFADVSDIMGGLTNCECQNLWGHSLSYWERDLGRIQREAFANMYSVAFGSQERIDAMKKYFPTAYSRFEEILEVLR